MIGAAAAARAAAACRPLNAADVLPAPLYSYFLPANLPSRASLPAPCSCEDTEVPARGRAVVKTGLQIAIPPGTYARVAPRSGLAVKHFIDTGAWVGCMFLKVALLTMSFRLRSDATALSAVHWRLAMRWEPGAGLGASGLLEPAAAGQPSDLVPAAAACLSLQARVWWTRITAARWAWCCSTTPTRPSQVSMCGWAVMVPALRLQQ